MSQKREIQLSRDCDAIQIPSGNPIVLPIGTSVMITQALGGTYTVATQAGLARISENDADALGIEKSEKQETSAASGEVSEDQIWDQLKSVFDPEIPVNVVDLGLIYDCKLEETDEGGTRASVKMTLTAPGCGMGPTIAADAQSKILSLDGVDEATVDLVWDPPWDQSMISEAGKMKLGLM